MKAHLPFSGSPVAGAVSSWLTGRRALILLACYFSLHALFRTLISNSAELDESEQLLWTQSWSWGYGSDPPLYVWLQILVFQVFGTHIFALALLKNALLFSAFLFTYLGAKEITGDERLSVVAMLSLLLFPQITWESQRDLTNSILATTLAAATFYVVVRVTKSRAPWDYLWLGFCLGLGTLSKYNYCLLVGALFLAAVTIPALRKALLNKWMLLSVAVFLLVTALHFHWVVLSPEAALNRSEELVSGRARWWLIAWGVGLLSIVKCGVLLGGALALVYWMSFSRAQRVQPARDCPEYQPWLKRTFLIVLFICLVAVVVARVELRDRWFQPIVFLGAIAAALLVRDRLTAATEKRFLRWIGLIGVTVLLVLPAIPLVAAITRRPTRLNAPYAALSAQLKAAAPSASSVIVAGNRLTGGNLRLFFPQNTVLAPECRAVAVPSHAPWLVVWDGTKSVQPPPALVKLVTRLRGTNLMEAKPAYVEAPCRYTHAKTMKLGYVVLAGGGI